MSVAPSPSSVQRAAASTQLSRTLSKILRHAAPSLGLALDASGYASVTSLLALPMVQRLGRVSLADLQQVVADCPKQRFGLLTPKEADGEWRIRANQGHNAALASKIDEAALLSPLRLDGPVAALEQPCIHGTSLSAWRVIESSGGLHPMARTHIHFASVDFGSSAMVSGMRASSEVLVHVDLRSALEWAAQSRPPMKLAFSQSANGVILTAGVEEFERRLPTFLFTRVERVTRTAGRGSVQRNNMQWQRPTEEEWRRRFLDTHGVDASTETHMVDDDAPNGATVLAAATAAPASARSSPPPPRPQPLPSRWGPAPTSRPPPGWVVPQELKHIVDRAESVSAVAVLPVPASSSPSPDTDRFRVATDSDPADFFVSGHLDLTSEDFASYYEPSLLAALNDSPNARFVMGNGRGADARALAWLLARDIDPTRITVVVHMPNVVQTERERVRLRRLRVHVRTGDFLNHAQRDAAMTRASRADIAWIRPDEETRALYGAKYRPGRVSGTELNLRRRQEQAAATSKSPSAAQQQADSATTAAHTQTTRPTSAAAPSSSSSSRPSSLAAALNRNRSQPARNQSFA